VTSDRSFQRRLWNKWRRVSISQFARRDFTLNSDVPLVSFTFDDFPRTALTNAGQILANRGAHGTYFVSSQMLGGPSASGPIASRDDLSTLVQAGHELGCHTFEHLDGCRSTPEAFERSIAANEAAVAECVPGLTLPIFAYPLDGPVLSVKKAVSKHFVGCRWGGQSFNAGVADLNLLKAYFLDERTRHDLDAVRAIIQQNADARGWLIFATHDVNPNPSPYGCAPDFFDAVVRLSLESGARVVPMMQACRQLKIAA